MDHEAERRGGADWVTTERTVVARLVEDCGAGEHEGFTREEVSRLVLCIAASVPQPVFTITEKAPTRAFSWLKVPTSAFTFKTLLRHYAKRALTPW